MSITNPDRDIADAQALYESLEERVRSGDESVTSEELDQARGLSRFAQLRKEAAQRKAAQARRDEAAQDVREAAEAAREYLDGLDGLDGLGGIDEQKAALGAALSAWADESRETLQELREHGSRLSAVNAAAAELGVADSWDAHGVRGGDDGHFVIRDVRRFSYDEHRQLDLTQVLRELCEAAWLQLVGEVRWMSRR